MMCDVWFMMRRSILGSACLWIDWRAKLPRLKTETSTTSVELNSSTLRPCLWRLISAWAKALEPLTSRLAGWLRRACCLGSNSPDDFTVCKKQKLRHVTLSKLWWLGLCVPVVIHRPVGSPPQMGHGLPWYSHQGTAEGLESQPWCSPLHEDAPGQTATDRSQN